MARKPRAATQPAHLVSRLHGTAGNRAVARLLAPSRTLAGPVIQRTPEDAARVLRAAGHVNISKRAFGDWLKAKEAKGPGAKKNSELYGVSAGDLAEVQRLITAMREQAAAAEKIERARAQLATAQREAPGVQIVHQTVIVNLDTDQLKHQPPGYPIGTRPASGGEKWPADLRPDAAWHQANTLPIIGAWAAALVMQDGDSIATKQSVPLSDGNHYEGFCVQVDGTKYVFFHCYPPRK